MCKPLRSCFCLSLRTGVRLIAFSLILCEIGLLIHNSILVDQNNGEFVDITGRQLDNYYIQMAAIIGGYIFAILFNVLLLWASGTRNKWLILPWLIFYFVVIVGLITAVPVILIWFIWLHPAPIWSLLSIIPAFLALMVTYFWLVVNGFFMEVCDALGPRCDSETVVERFNPEYDEPEYH